MALPEAVGSRRIALMERRLNEIGSQVKGNSDFAADRLSDVIEQVSEIAIELDKMVGKMEALQKQMRTLVERQDRAAEFLNELRNERKNGG